MEEALEKSRKEKLKCLIHLATIALVVEHTKLMEDDPQTFNKAWNHPDPKLRRKWQEAIEKDFGDMNKQQVWRKIHKKLMPLNLPYVKNKWVFKIKHNCVYWTHLVSCRYSQVPGLEFSKNYSLVVNNITFRILLIMDIHPLQIVG